MAAGGATFAGTGAVAVGTGVSITGNASSKINSASHNVQYSFAKSYDEQKQNVGKTSETMVKNVKGKLKGKTKDFRVDVEPDSNKIQIQAGKGKNSDKDIRIKPKEITDDQSIIDQIKNNDFSRPRAKFSDDALKQLVKGVRKAMEKLK